MTARVNRIGKRYNRLLVTSGPTKKLHPSGDLSLYWKCVCDCGVEKKISGKALASGLTKSCGCLNSERSRERHLVHGMAGTSEYRTWQHMLYRCHNNKAKEYQNYGGRGISVCGQWRRSFEAFFDHVGLKPRPDLSIDRIDNDGDYEPGNVRWATSKQQNENRRQMKQRMRCVAGHEFTEDNTYTQKSTGFRQCIECRRRRDRNRSPRPKVTAESHANAL